MTNKELTELMIKQLLHEWACTKSISTAYDICSTLCEYYKINVKDTGKASSNDSWKLLDIYMNIGKITNQKEPLIKDEKVRKAVRVWAEALEENTIRFDRVSQGFSFGDGNLYSSINFDGFVFNLVDGKKYTITELCGEEEK